MTMMKVKIRARRLKDAEAKWVALVNRGANRVPFRIMKQEDPDMKGIDLTRLWKSDSKASVVAVVVKAGTDLEAAKKIIAKLGFKTDVVKTEAEGTMFVQSEATGPLSMMKINENVAVAMANVNVDKVKKLFNMPNLAVDFNELMAEEAFLPTLWMAEDKLCSVICNIINAATNPQEASTMFSEAVDQFKALVIGMIEQIPMMAYKLEALEEVEKVGPPSPASGGPGPHKGVTGQMNPATSPNLYKEPRMIPGAQPNVDGPGVSSGAGSAVMPGAEGKTPDTDRKDIDPNKGGAYDGYWKAEDVSALVVAAKNGDAMDDGSWPIRNKIELQVALKAYKDDMNVGQMNSSGGAKLPDQGKGKKKKSYKSKKQVYEHINARATDLEALDLLPAEWNTAIKDDAWAELDHDADTTAKTPPQKDSMGAGGYSQQAQDTAGTPPMKDSMGAGGYSAASELADTSAVTPPQKDTMMKTEPTLADVLKAVGDLKAGVDTQFKTVQGAVDALGTRVAAAEATVQKVDAAVSGVTNARQPGDTAQEVKKSDQKRGFRHIDTGIEKVV